MINWGSKVVPILESTQLGCVYDHNILEYIERSRESIGKEMYMPAVSEGKDEVKKD